MSRTTPDSEVYLVVRNEQPVVRSEPFDYSSYKTDFGALVTLLNVKTFANNTAMPYEVWLLIIHYLLAKNALQCIAPVIVLEKFPKTEEQLINLQLSLRTTASLANSIPYLFFTRGVRYQGYEVACLLDAALNADLAILKMILKNNRHPEILLSIVGNVKTDLGITRKGTALELALMSGDEEMAEEIAQYLDPAEIERQFKNVFGPDFSAFLKQQEKEAEALFEGLEAEFNGLSPEEVANAIAPHEPNIPLALQQKIAEFQDKLETYAKTHLVHNPFILAKAYDIYDENWDLWPDSGRASLFTQQLMNLILKSCLETSKIWSMHIAEGIYSRSLKINQCAARRSFILSDILSERIFPQQERNIHSHIASNSRNYVDISGRGLHDGYMSPCSRSLSGIWYPYYLSPLKELLQAKKSGFENLLRPRNHISHAVL